LYYSHKAIIFVVELPDVGEWRLPLLILLLSALEKEHIVQIASGVIESLEREDMFLVDVIFRKGRQSLVHVLVDTDSGVKLAECVSISRKMSALLEEDPIMQFPYTLEVSSPGLDRPLDSPRQYLKNIGRELIVQTIEGEPVTGVLDSVNVSGIVLKVSIPKKKETSLQAVSFDMIKESKVKISFKTPRE